VLAGDGPDEGRDDFAGASNDLQLQHLRAAIDPNPMRPDRPLYGHA
jgi:hypothetical protein